jgi:hypothetical protein
MRCRSPLQPQSGAVHKRAIECTPRISLLCNSDTEHLNKPVLKTSRKRQQIHSENDELDTTRELTIY